MTALKGQVVIVTGAGKGLGRAYAVYLASKGASVLVNNRRHPGEHESETSAMKTVQMIRSQGGIAEANFADVTNAQSGIDMLSDALAHFGDVHAVVANAGVERLGRFESISLEEFNSVFETSFFGNLYLIRAAWNHWLETGQGRAVMTTSGAGLYGNHGQVAYSAAKAAVIGMVHALAIEGASKNIFVNALAPYAYTAMTREHIDAHDAALLDPEKIAPLVAYLISPECRMTGETLVCAGGYIRRAYTQEGPSIPIDNPIENALSVLLETEGSSFESATASFNDFLSAIRRNDIGES